MLLSKSLGGDIIFRKIFIFIFITLLLLSGCTANKREFGLSRNSDVKSNNSNTSEMAKTNKLTIEKVKQLSKKGKDLTWEDFQTFEGKDIGSGLYIMEYKIDDNYSVLVGGAGHETKPMYVRLVRSQDKGFIDIRYDDVDKFLKQ